MRSESGHFVKVAMIFVSYARADKDFVDRLIGMLEQRGLETWVDRRGIPGGTLWEAEISKALEHCSAVVVVLSPAVRDSAHVATELSLAHDYHRPIIPILREAWESVEPSESVHRLRFLLAGRQVIDFSTGRLEEGLVPLLEAVSDAPAARSRVTPSTRSRPGHAFRSLIVAGGLGLMIAATGLIVWPRTSPVTSRPPIGPNASPSIEGTWFAEVAYSWGLRESEQFEFTVNEERVQGTASFGGPRFPRHILEGKLTGDRLFFIVKLQTLRGREESEVVYQYRGEVRGARIHFTLDNEGNPSTRFVAARTPDEAKSAAPRLPTGGTKPNLSSLIAGSYGVDLIRTKIGEQQNAIRSCYVATEFDSVDHVFVGYVVAIGANGRVIEVRPQGSDQRSVDLDRCMERVLRSVNWGAPPNGRNSEIRLMFRALPSWRSQ